MPAMSLSTYIPPELLELYEVHNYCHAAEVMHTSCRQELDELVEVLLTFRLSIADITAPGGNESSLPELLSALLKPHRLA
jgi:hypothetical protein